jgi:hypothetical protein
LLVLVAHLKPRCVSSLAAKSLPPQGALLAALLAARAWPRSQRRCRWFAPVAPRFHSLRLCVRLANILAMRPSQPALLDLALGITLAARLPILWPQPG